MVLKADQQRVKALLSETITLLCKNGLNFKREFSIEGLIGITLDQDEIFLVSIKETIRSALAEAAASSDPGGGGKNASASAMHVNSSAVSRRRRERDVEIKRTSSPTPLVMSVESAGDQYEGGLAESSTHDDSSRSKPSTSAALTGESSTSMKATPKRETIDGDDNTIDADDQSALAQPKSDLNLTFSNIPLNSEEGGFDEGRSNKRRRLQSHQTARASATVGSAASNDASSGSGFETFQTHEGETNRGSERTKLNRSDIIEIKDELLSGGEGEGEEGVEGDESYADYGGGYDSMYETGDQGEGDVMNMYAGGVDGGDIMGGMGAAANMVPRRRSAPHGNGGASSRQDPVRGSISI